MKTFRFIGMALFAILMCVNLSSCSSSDDDPTEEKEEGVVTNEKKLVEFKETNEDGHTNTYVFNYDSKGRIISIVEKESDRNSNRITNFTWGDNKIIESREGESFTYSLTDNLIQTTKESDGGYNFVFAYNKSKQLTNSSYSYDYGKSFTTYTWQGEKLTSHVYVDEYDDEEETATFTYGNKTCKGYFPLAGFLVQDDYRLFLAHPELVGMRMNHLPTQIKAVGSNFTSTDNMTYTFDDEGYVESFTDEYIWNSNGETDTGLIIYTFKWE